MVSSKPMSRTRPRTEIKTYWCAKCKHKFETQLLMGVIVDAVIACLKTLRCPKCRGHRCWIHLL